MPHIRAFSILLLSFFCSVGILHGQEQGETIVFDSELFDFGKIHESDGQAVHIFRFLCKSDRAIRIGHVEPGCRCVSASWTREEVAPGGTGEVEVIFDPAGAAGELFRSVFVYLEDGQCHAVLSIRAEVEPRSGTEDRRYRHAIGHGLKADTDFLNLGYIHPGQTGTGFVHILSSGGAAAETAASFASAGDSGLEVALNRTGAETEIAVRRTSAGETPHTISDTLHFTADGRQCEGGIIVEAILTGTASDGEDAPVLWSSPSESRTRTITIGNRGRGDLVIYNVENPSGTRTDIGPGTVIRPGRKRTVKIRTEKPGTYTVRIFTNDPSRPIKDLIYSLL